MEAMFILVSLAAGTSLVVVLFSCLKCRQKLTEEEKRNFKHLNIFRRSLIRKRHTLANRVDYIRSIVVSESVSSEDGSSIDWISEHMYEDLRNPGTPNMPVIQVTGASPSSGTTSEHSFFDDSFQTVIEASSIAAPNGTQRLPGLLETPGIRLKGNRMPTYLDLQQHLQDSSALGEDNAGFSVSMNSNRFEPNRRQSLDSGSYAMPNSGPRIQPRIQVVHPSLRLKPEYRRPALNPDTHSLYDLPITPPDDTDLERCKDFRALRQCLNKRSEMYQNCGINKQSRDESKGKGVAGTSSCDTETKFEDDMSPVYERLKMSKTTDFIYTTLGHTALLLPPRPSATSPIMSPESNVTPSNKSENTYESITSQLAAEINRRESLSSQETELKKTMSNDILDTPESRGSYSAKTTNVTNSGQSGNHTYESLNLKTPETPARLEPEPQFDSSVVIIGRRVSNPFDSKNRVAKRMINKKKLRPESARNFGSSAHKNSSINTSDGEPRYSPFPSATKLAFKPAFKQIASPKMCPLPSVTGKLFDNSLSKTEMCFNDLNTNTPEIKVENNAKYCNNKAYLSPFCLSKNFITELNSDSPSVISPISTFETLKICNNLKVSKTNLDTDFMKKEVHYKKSLGSVTESLENDIIEHCNMNIYAMSTPSEPQVPIHTCGHF